MACSRADCFRITTMVMIAVAGAAAAEGDFISSKATYFKSPDGSGNPRGACGYGEYGQTIYGGSVAAVSKLYRNGIGCGACYQVRCKIPELCSEEGAKVVVTDYGEGDNTDFILSEHAFSELALPDIEATHHLFAKGVADIEFKRIPCEYTSNLLIKIHEHSHCPDYLALLPIYQPSTYEIVAIEFCEEGSKEWKRLRKAYGAVWDLENPPLGDLKIKIKLCSYPYPKGEEDKNTVDVELLIPAKWEPGTTFDTGFHGIS